MLQRLILLLVAVMMSVYAVSQQWVFEYPSDEKELTYFISGDMSGDYNYSVGYKYDEATGITYPIAMCFDKNGNHKVKVYDDIVVKGYFCCSLGLGDGYTFVVARCGDDCTNEIYEKLWIAVINPNLEIMNSSHICVENPYISYGYAAHALINDNNEIVVVTQIADSIPMEANPYYDYAFYKINRECVLLKYSYLDNTSRYCDIADFTLIPDTELYAVFGNGMRANGLETVFYVDEDFNFRSSNFIDNTENYPNLLYPKFVCVDHWLDENCFLMSAQSSRTNGMNEWCPLVLKMDTEMNVLNKLSLERLDTTDYVSQYRSMAYIDVNTIYISTFRYSNSLNVTKHGDATVYMIDEDLNLLGRKDFEIENFFNILYIQPTIDKGCIIQGYIDDGDLKKSVICKLAKDDFEIKTNVLENVPYDTNVYPNPVSSLLYIDVKSLEDKEINVKIFDILGRRYMDKDISLNGDVLSFDLSALPNGVYLYHIECDNRCYGKNMFVKE